MKALPSTEDLMPTTLHVDETPLSLRLPAGAAIFAVRGEAWITQERMLDDIVLKPGERFDVPNREQLVISATRGEADLFIARPAAARQHALDSVYDFARCRAARLRREELARLADTVAAGLRARLLRLRAALTVGRRATTS